MIAGLQFRKVTCSGSFDLDKQAKGVFFVIDRMNGKRAAKKCRRRIFNPRLDKLTGQDQREFFGGQQFKNNMSLIQTVDLSHP